MTEDRGNPTPTVMLCNQPDAPSGDLAPVQKFSLGCCTVTVHDANGNLISSITTQGEE